MTELAPRILPTTWDDAAELAAYWIDTKRKEGFKHPHMSKEHAITIMRNEFDDFAAKFYGNPPEDQIGGDWFIAMAIVTLDAEEHFVDERDLVGDGATGNIPHLRSKMEDYGHNNIQRFGLDGLIVRIHDKIARLENLTERDSGSPNHESINDTFTDIVGYCIIGWQVMLNCWLLPLRENDKTLER